MIKTGNAVTDVVLSETAEKCEKEGITFESAFAYPEGLDINPFDISVVLTNALQNAVEASSSVSDPQIRIKSVQKERVFIINVRNIIQRRVYITEDGLPDHRRRTAGNI